MSISSGRASELAKGFVARVSIVASLAVGAAVAPASDAILPRDHSANFVKRFNAADNESAINLVPNAAAAEWIASNTPRFDCPSGRFVETYYYRWWTYRKHIKATPDGRVLTEFITPVSHAGAHNTIACAIGHHIAEGRWLADKALLDEYLRFWFTEGPNGGPQPHLHKFSGWIAAAIDGRRRVTGDDAFAIDLLDALVADYYSWEEERLLPSGLFWQRDVADGMEESISGGRHVQNVRPTINSYMVGNARAIAHIARDAGRGEVAVEFEEKANTLAAKSVEAMWDAKANFFKVRLESDKLSDAREAIGYLPWLHGLAGPAHSEAWRQTQDHDGFWAPAGLTTAERRHPSFRTRGVGTCEWDGAVWPFATSQTLGAMAVVLRGPEQTNVTRRDYFEHLIRYAASHQRDGVAYIGEYHDEVTGDWLITGEKEKRSRYYNHSTFCDLVITGLAGVIPQDDSRVVVDPMLPADAWDWFCLDGVPYRGRQLCILWDRDGTRYDRIAGLSVWIDGKMEAHSPQLGRLAVNLSRGTSSE
ncbi:MGH1-like glycoside hydrolase domain-containing protein [Botrimarina mediterranea]|uniref:Beta-L-arabinobiosidase n=1 Tax=Botrimarina mediterranea TaxID=2528022 RepID=A0A518K9H5_9BACT|nr:glycosyl hydrolase family 65 protein [Botrimarina mediterranea]QDV74423.1 Beta-L-arabinobiosidase precursor [Botrimarina mediterranea]QDV79019.1 Beta-L-arabinobiosidase precursor [Planctomycetes bacterium K2D]